MSVQEKINEIEKQIEKQNQPQEKSTDKKQAVKEYNTTYYKKNKTKIISQLCEKVECGICGRRITKNRLNLHKSTALCKNTLEQKIRDEKIINSVKLNFI